MMDPMLMVVPLMSRTRTKLALYQRISTVGVGLRVLVGVEVNVGVAVGAVAGFAGFVLFLQAEANKVRKKAKQKHTASFFKMSSVL
jgi:hypothetical protein